MRMVRNPVEQFIRADRRLRTQSMEQRSHERRDILRMTECNQPNRVMRRIVLAQPTSHMDARIIFLALRGVFSVIKAIFNVEHRNPCRKQLDQVWSRELVHRLARILEQMQCSSQTLVDGVVAKQTHGGDHLVDVQSLLLLREFREDPTVDVTRCNHIETKSWGKNLLISENHCAFVMEPWLLQRLRMP